MKLVGLLLSMRTTETSITVDSKVLILSTVKVALVGHPRLYSQSNKLPGSINLFCRNNYSYREPGLTQIVVPRSVLKEHELGGTGVVSPTR